MLSLGVAVWMIGAVSAPAEAASGVSVSQQPLIVQPALAPNVTLMLDDSGSMAWDFMPDASYLTGATKVSYDRAGDTYWTVSIDSLRNAANNGTYYNPTVTYSPPPQAAPDSKGNTQYYTKSPGIGTAFADGFTDQQAADEVDVTTYTSHLLCDYNNFNLTTSGNNACPSALYSAFPYFTSFTDSYYNASLVCSSGTLQNSGSHSGMCKTGSGSSATYSNPTPTCNSGDTYNTTKAQCDQITTTSTPSSSTANLFTYTTTNADGTYAQHYVGKSSSDCAYAPSNTCTYDSTVAQNVANWFSYYRTRILMAKSGLMTAFTGIDPTFRIGFGSIDGNNNTNLPSSQRFSVSSAQTISEVQPFGDGTSSTQKANFWAWISGVKANNGTPLRQALDTVGQYYEKNQPWQTDTTSTASDAEMLACRLSYTILTTDGFWNDSVSPGEYDGATGTTVTGPNNQTYTYKPTAPYTDSTVVKNGKIPSYPNTLADVAMKYWETDLMGGATGTKGTTTGQSVIANEVPTSTEDPAFWQHMTTFTLGLGFTPSGISPSGTTIDQIFGWANGGSAISNFSWPQPASNSINNIADLAHAAVNGHGGFYSATSPTSFTNGLVSALNRAAQRTGTGASLSANSTQLTSGTVAYQANYTTVKWTGELKALSIDPTSGAISTTSKWNASTQLPAFGSRSIYTYNPTSNAMVAFSDPSALSSAEQSALGSAAADQQSVINYLRGDSSNEQPKTGATYRQRSTPLGDIVNSQPVYSGAPNANQFVGATFTGSDSYAAYAATNKTRTALIWVAANDGMLHAFDAGTGTESFAYIPAAVITSNLKSLSDPTYGQTGTILPHQFFNDGQLTIADAYWGSAWHTVLVGTTGRGLAKAVYAFDITTPSSPKFLWERSAGDSVDTNSKYIGQMTSQPIIAQTSSNPGDTTATSQWSVLIGNGYNSVAGTSALLQFNLQTGALTVHTTTDTSTSNGLAGPAVWLNAPANGVSTTAYAGDLDGNVWSFVLNNGSLAKDATPSSAGTLLFTAKDAGSKAQPITAGLLAGRDPGSSNLWLFFGTGQYLDSPDLKDKSVQTWYGIIVQTANTSLPALSGGRSALKQRAIIAETSGNSTATPPVLPARAVTAAPANPDMGSVSGWYMDLEQPNTDSNGNTTYTAQGERMVTPNQFQGALLLGTTRIPIASDPCDPSGQGWIMAVDPFTGTNPSSNFFDLNGDGAINSSDTVTVNGKTYPAAGVGFSSLPNNPIFVGGTMLVSFDNGTNSSIGTSGSTGALRRVSWRELIKQ